MNHRTKIKIKGELKVRKLAAIRSRLLPYSNSDIELDLSDVIEFDSAGLQLLLSLNKELVKKGFKLHIISASQSVEKILRFYNKQSLLSALVGTNSEGQKIGSAR